MNRVKHGARAKRFGCVLARLGRKFEQQYMDAVRFRRKLEAELRERCGELSFQQIARVQTACRLEESIRALEWTIREEQELGPEALRKTRNDISTWSERRDAILEELLGGQEVSGGGKGSKGRMDPWSALGEVQAVPPASAPESGGGEPDDWQAAIVVQPKKPEAKAIQTIRSKVLAGHAPLSAAEAEQSAGIDGETA